MHHAGGEVGRERRVKVNMSLLACSGRNGKILHCCIGIAMLTPDTLYNYNMPVKTIVSLITLLANLDPLIYQGNSELCDFQFHSELPRRLFNNMNNVMKVCA